MPEGENKEMRIPSVVVEEQTYTIQSLQLKELEKMIVPGRFQWVLIQSFSFMELCSVEADTWKNISQEELLSARFFSEKEEIHIFEEDDSLKAVLCRDNDKDDSLKAVLRRDNAKDDSLKAVLCNDNDKAAWFDEEFAVRKQFEKVGSSLLVRRYVSYDADGQAYIRYSRLCAVKKGERKYGK